MYRTCIFCYRDLGSNESIENFPVGRKLVFDGAPGRLWVICEACRRWNLTPLQERWEAIEECERHFHDTPRRYSTDHIGLAELRDGLQLVRTGEPRRSELAACRYGRAFWRRRTRKVAKTGGRTVLAVAGGVAAFAGAHVVLPVWQFIHVRRTTLRVRDPEGRVFYFGDDGPTGAKLVRDDSPEGWHLHLPHHVEERRRLLVRRVMGQTEVSRLRGENAIYVAWRILPFDQLVRRPTRSGRRRGVPHRGGPGPREDVPEGSRAPAHLPTRSLGGGSLPQPDQEHGHGSPAGARDGGERGDGETGPRGRARFAREDAWRGAEEIAAIADRLLIERRIESWKARREIEKEA